MQKGIIFETGHKPQGAHGFEVSIAAIRELFMTSPIIVCLCFVCVQIPSKVCYTGSY